MTTPMPHGQHNGERMGIYQLNQGVYRVCVWTGGGGVIMCVCVCDGGGNR